MSVMLTKVLLKVARMFAMPLLMFLAPLALIIFLPAISSASSSAAVGAAAGAPATASGALGASATGVAASPPGAAAGFFGLFGAWPSAAGFPAGFSAASGLDSF